MSEDSESLYQRYRNNVELMKAEKPSFFKMWEYHLIHIPVTDYINQFNNWLYEYLYSNTTYQED